MRLVLVRHGETQWVREGRYQGTSNVPLNARGRKQAQAVGRVIRDERPFAIYSSELIRVRETAEIIAKASRRKVRTDRRLNEVSFGKWEGSLFREIRERYPKDVRRWYKGYWSSHTGKYSVKILVDIEKITTATTVFHKNRQRPR